MKRSAVLAMFAGSIALATACASESPGPGLPGGQSGTEGSSDDYCERVSERLLEAGEAVGGHTAAELAASAEGAHDVAVRWYSAAPSGAVTPEQHATEARIELSVDVALAREVQQQVRASGEPCSPAMEIPATLLVRSADGAFDERLRVILTGTPSNPRTSVTVSPDDLTGTYEPMFFAADEPQMLGFAVHFRTDPGSGRVFSDGHAFVCPRQPGRVCAFAFDW